MNAKDKKVQSLLDETMMTDPEKYSFLLELREIVFKVYPKAEEKIKYGGIMFSLNSEDFCGLFVRKNHISLEFANGIAMKDPDKLLEGKGKFRRHLKIRSNADIKNRDASFFVKQAV